MIKKYEFTDEKMDVGEFIFHRIVSLRDFGDVKKGDQLGLTSQ